MLFLKQYVILKYMKDKLKIGVLDLTDCEGCELEFLNLRESLLKIASDFEIINWRLVSSEKKLKPFDAVFVEGSVMKKEEEKLLKTVRKATNLLIALGACATNGNINAMIKKQDRAKATEYVYGKAYKPLAEDAKPLKDYVKVDINLEGCPVTPEDIEKVLNELKKVKPIDTKEEIVAAKEFKDDHYNQYLAKIEGHGTLGINFDHNDVQLKVTEGERLIEAILLKRDFKQAPYITSRICGVCPTSHTFASIKAIEDAFGIIVSEQTKKLRKIMQASQIIQSHVLHLFFLALPDFYNLKSAIEIGEQFPNEYHIALSLKKMADLILTKIGGRSIHPLFPTLGGFTELVSQNDLAVLRDLAIENLNHAEAIVKMILALMVPKLDEETEYLALDNGNNYPLYDGNTISNLGANFPAEEFEKEISESVKNYASAKFSLRKNRAFKVGALARINLFSSRLNEKAKKLFNECGWENIKNNPFSNNLAQAIEIIHFNEEIINLLDDAIKNYKQEKTALTVVLPKQNIHGFGAIEAPRGTLYHHYEIRPDGKIINANILTPTAQNLTSIEKDAELLLKTNEQKSQEEKTKMLETLIRAYDPCITCSVH